MAYIDLHDGQRAAALLPYLVLAERLRGTCICYAIEESIGRFFPAMEEAIAGKFSDGTWKVGSFERLLRFSNFAALSIAIAATHGEDVFLISDEGQYCDNKALYHESVQVYGQVLSLYVSATPGHLRFCTTARDSGSLQLEDLCSISDLVAGAVADVATAIGRSAMLDSKLVAQLNYPVPRKSSYIVNWLERSESELRKVVVVIKRRSGITSVSSLRIHSEGGLIVPRSVHVDAIKGRHRRH